MLLIKNKLAPSAIHGIGVFAEEFISAGTIIWEWHPDIDRKVSPELVASMPPNCQETFKRYGWVKNDYYIICIDNEKYINHSYEPNCVFTEDRSKSYAKRDIQAGEEITQNYREFDDNFGKEEFGYDWKV